MIVLGSNGMLGSMICFLATKYNRPFVSLSKSDFNIYDNISKLDTYLSSDSIIINCIGAIPQKDYSIEEYNIINTIFPQNLSIYCKMKHIKLIHISTNCVFSGSSDSTEMDIPNATDIYGISKYLGEPSYGLVIRCSIIGPEKHTFCGLLEWFLHSNEVYGFIDSFWNGITTLELSNIIFDYIDGSIDGSIPNKLVHYYSENTVSKYDILTYVNKYTNVIIHKKENNLAYYTLSSIYTTPRKNIYNQIDELFSIFYEYKQFYNIKP